MAFSVSNLLLLSLFAHLTLISSFEWPASPLDKEPLGDCPDISLKCIPYANLSFADQVWQGKPQEHWIRELNKEMKTKSSKLSKKMYIRDTLETVFSGEKGIFFGEKVKKGETIGEFNPKSLISSELTAEAFKGKPYYSEHRKLFSSFKWFGNSDAVLRLTLNILYHLYHIEDSPVKSDLRALPQNITMFGFVANDYELETLLKNDISSSFIQSIRNRTMYEFAYLRAFMPKFLSKKEMKSFLNGRDAVSPDDYAYATSIVYQRSVSDSLSLGKDEKGEETIKYFYFIPFATHYAKLRDQNLPEGGYVKTHFDNKTGDYKIQFISNDDYDKGDEFLIDYFITENYRMLAIHGIAYKDNERECLKLKFLEDETTAKYQLPSTFSPL